MAKSGMEKTGRIVIQDMLSEGSGKHIQWSPHSGRSNHLRCGGDPVWQVHGWPWRGEALWPARHILGGWCRRSLIPARFSPHPTSCNTDGSAGPARWPFS